MAETAAVDFERLPDLAAIDRELIARGGLAEFMRMAWPIVEPADPLQWNWHHDAMCEHVEAVLRHEIRNLLINVPPGTSKSTTVSVMASAYAWTLDPAYRILATSHAAPLSRRDSRKVRALIRSSWYQQRWPTALIKEDESRLENDRSGFRIIITGGTGERGNLILVDDLLSREYAESEAHRRQASEFFWETLPTRLNDYRRDGKIVIAQRLHQDDPPGQILERAKDSWTCLILPNEYEPERRCVTVLGFEDPRTTDGELLHSDRLDQETTDLMKTPAGIGPHAYAGQFQQRPAPREGTIIKAEWLENRFRVRGENPRLVAQSWDCASKAAERNDPSVCGTFAVFKDRVELWHVSVARQEFPDMKRRAIDLYNSEDARGPKAPNVVLIEDKSAGEQLIQQLRRETRMPIVACNPGSLDKDTRLEAESTFIEAKKLWLPQNAPWVAHYVDEMTTFPSSTNKDQVDMTSQFLKWLREKGSLNRLVAPVSLTREKPGPT